MDSMTFALSTGFIGYPAFILIALAVIGVLADRYARARVPVERNAKA